MAENKINIVIGADIEKLKKGFQDAVKITGASGNQINSKLEATAKAIEKDFERISNSTNTKRAVTQLQNLALKVQALGPEFQDMANKIIRSAGGIKDSVQDVSAQIDYFSSDTRRIDAVVSAAQGVAGAFGIAEGAAALFGSENEDLQKTMAKVQGAIALLNGIQAVQNVLQAESAAVTGLNAAAQQVLAIKAYATASAMNALKLALLATGIGAAVVIIGALASAYSEASDKADLLAATTKKAQEQAQEQAKESFDFEKSFIQKRIQEIGKEEKAKGKSEQQQLKSQIDFLKAQAKLRFEDYKNAGDSNKLKGDLLRDYTNLQDQIYSLELDLQIQSNDDKKKAREQAIKDREKSDIKELEVMKKGIEKMTALELKKRPGGGGGAPAIKPIAPIDYNPMQYAPDEMINGEMVPGKELGKKFADVQVEQQQDLNKRIQKEWFNMANYYRTANGQMEMEAIKAQQKKLASDAKYIEANKMFVDNFNATFKNIQTDALSNLGESIGDALLSGANLLDSVFSVILNSVASFADAYGKALIASAVASEAFQKLLIANPIAAAAAGVALVVAATVVRGVAQKGVTAFANGGIVSGPTLGLMGEYPGASSNPEVIAPLDKLKSLIGGGGDSGGYVAETRISGRDLSLVLKRYERDAARG
jgi:hypothetical protein